MARSLPSSPSLRRTLSSPPIHLAFTTPRWPASPPQWRSPFTILLTLLLLLPPSTTADYRLGPQGFNFLPLQSVSKLSGPTLSCSDTLNAYIANWTSSPDRGTVRSAAAYEHEVCLLSHADEGLKAYLATANILLGLAPVLLSTVGPTTPEVGLLSMERPLLALLLSVGSAAFGATRTLNYAGDDSREMLVTPTIVPPALFASLASDRRRTARRLLSALEYALACLAGFNVLWTSWQLGLSTVLTFEVHISWLSLFWSTVAMLIHVPIFLAFRIRRLRARKQRRHERVAGAAEDDHLPGGRAAGGAKGSHGSANGLDRRTPMETEMALSIMHAPVDPKVLEATPAGISLHYLASITAFAHVVLGVPIFSSLLFTALLDAAVILLRYLASVLACRLILMFELAGMKWAYQLELGRVKDGEGEVSMAKEVGRENRR